MMIPLYTFDFYRARRSQFPLTHSEASLVGVLACHHELAEWDSSNPAVELIERFCSDRVGDPRIPQLVFGSSFAMLARYPWKRFGKDYFLSLSRHLRPIG